MDDVFKNELNLVKRIYLALSFAFVAWFFSYFSTLSSMVTVWYNSDTFTHCFLIVPIVAFLFYERRDELISCKLKPTYFLILPLIFVQIVHLLAQLLGINIIGHMAAYASTILIIWSFLGHRFVLTFIFPLLYLGFTVPVGEELVPILQEITAYFSVLFLQWSGIPIYREGLYLYVPNGTFLVAEACAGIRFLIAAIALGTLYAYMNFKTKWKFYGFIALSCVVPIIANGIRAYGIVVIGYLSDMEHATGADHLVYGWFFFAIVLVILFFIGELGKENTLKSRKEREHHVNSETCPPNKTFIIVALLSILTIPVYAKIFIFNEYKIDKNTDLSSLIEEKISSSVEVEKGFTWEPNMVNAHEYWFGKGKRRQTYIAKYHYDNDEHELVSGLNRPFNIDLYSRKGSTQHEISDGFINQIDLVNAIGEQVRLFYWYEVDGKKDVRPLATKISQLQSKLEGRAGQGYFVAVNAQTLEEALNSVPSLQ